MSNIDLTKSENSLTYPKLPDPLISRETLIKWIHDRFSQERKVILIHGPDGSGKTTLLAQFAKTYSDVSCNYFIKNDYYTSKPSFFLNELCAQINILLDRDEERAENDHFKLREQFTSLYHQLAKKASRKEGEYYFVIDGLERITSTNDQNNILELLPINPLDNWS
jgi:ATP/maltotriose-dependent transcriptional regulator MalT